MDLGREDRDDKHSCVVEVASNDAAMDLGREDRDDAPRTRAATADGDAAMDLGREDRDDSPTTSPRPPSNPPQWISVARTETTRSRLSSARSP